MKTAIDGKLARRIDRYSIENGMPSMVLMERAALCTAECVKNITKNNDLRKNVIAVCSVGNNGADGLAAIRILKADGYNCKALIIGNMELATEEFKAQLGLIHFWEIPVKHWEEDIHADIFDEYNIIVDAVFGIGLSRNVEGEYARLVECINEAYGTVVAVDIPSGINSASGAVMGKAVRADYTVAFGYAKLGELLYPGRTYTGKLVVNEIGFLPYDFETNDSEQGSRAVYFGENDLHKMIPVRDRHTNKGSYGKPLIIAGSKDMTGAAFMSAMAAYRTGAGVVTVLTHSSADEYLKSVLPEAIVKSYDDNPEMILERTMPAASVIVIGPGMSVGELPKKIVGYVLLHAEVPVIADADALNIISENTDSWLADERRRSFSYPLIITPHVGEMSRLSGYEISEIASNIPHYALEFARRYRVYCVLKDAVSAVASENGELFLTTCGNPGMASAGSGDVLTGVLAAVNAWKGCDIFGRIALGVQLHAEAGDKAAEKVGEHSLMARDIIDAIPEVLMK